MFAKIGATLVAFMAISADNVSASRVQVNTLNQVISELDILEKAKLNT